MSTPERADDPGEAGYGAAKADFPADTDSTDDDAEYEGPDPAADPKGDAADEDQGT